MAFQMTPAQQAYAASVTFAIASKQLPNGPASGALLNASQGTGDVQYLLAVYLILLEDRRRVAAGQSV